MRTTSEKVHTVLERNTFYFFDQEFEANYETKNLGALTNLLQNVRARIKKEGIHKRPFEELLEHNYGLSALLALNGFSNESLKRLITLARIIPDNSFTKLICKSDWLQEGSESIHDFREWPDSRIRKLVGESPSFRRGLVNLFFEGVSDPFLQRVLPPFDLRKLSVAKLSFRPDAMLDTLVRYKEKGSYSGKQDNNPEITINNILQRLSISWNSGDLDRITEDESSTKRRMDFIIPNQQDPQVIVECSFLTTTSSQQGDKAKTEIGVRDLIAEYYPKAIFIGFVDGLGWYVRQRDLERMVEAFGDVFTFHPEELQRFEELIRRNIR